MRRGMGGPQACGEQNGGRQAHGAGPGECSLSTSCSDPVPCGADWSPVVKSKPPCPQPSPPVALVLYSGEPGGWGSRGLALGGTGCSRPRRWALPGEASGGEGALTLTVPMSSVTDVPEARHRAQRCLGTGLVPVFSKQPETPWEGRLQPGSRQLPFPGRLTLRVALQSQLCRGTLLSRPSPCKRTEPGQPGSGEPGIHPKPLGEGLQQRLGEAVSWIC
ncbi:hypothetical protein DR999_PMT19120 [Platysternon megacephalum]|uniref:Uncharacterized protein n=1 Tax=Platysternon megacephalum TaxID=55544 RepID=A0A4D9DRG4_9SAUR|nr:hypothetical protein DR999_PMT19120 [Platysternon megacephalum]